MISTVIFTNNRARIITTIIIIIDMKNAELLTNFVGRELVDRGSEQSGWYTINCAEMVYK